MSFISQLTGNNMKEGDIYNWSYKDLTGRGSEPYWATSRIARFKDGLLSDTYWGDNNHSNKSWAVDSLDQIQLSFIANINDLIPMENGKYSTLRYDESDIVNLSHPNRSDQYFIRKGATPSKDKCRKVLEAYIDHHVGKIEMMQADIERYKMMHSQMEANDDPYVPYIKGIWIGDKYT